MLLNALPDANVTHGQNDKLLELHSMLRAQLDDMTLLSSLAEYLQGFQQIGLDVRDGQTYTKKIEKVSDEQEKRFKRIDELINENILALKKEKTNDQSTFLFGKEVRKTESGLRTLKFFIEDVVTMLAPNSLQSNRVKDRLEYFDKRSKALEADIKSLQLEINYF